MPYDFKYGLLLVGHTLFCCRLWRFCIFLSTNMLRMQTGHGRRFRSTRCFMCPGYKLLIRPGPVDSGNPYPLSPLSRHPWRSIPIELIPVTKQRPHSNGARCLCPHTCACYIYISPQNRRLRQRTKLFRKRKLPAASKIDTLAALGL